MMRVTKKEMKVVWIVSLGIGIALIATVIANTFFFKSYSMILESDQVFFMALIAAIFPPAIAEYLDSRWRMNADKNIPEFLRELAEAGRTGVTLARAIDLASRRKYGVLSSELKRVAVKISWGGSLQDALEDFAKRINTNLAKRTSVIMREIARSGGEIKEVLEIVSKHSRELHMIEEERRSQLRMYIGIIYVAFFVFLFIDFLLLKTFFARIASLKEMMSEAGGLFSMGDIESIQSAMFHMAVIEGFFGGLVAGKMGEGAMGAGLKHAVILMSVALFSFMILM